MDREVIEAKLESLRRCLARIRQKTPPEAHLLAHDLDLQDIITLNLTRAVQLCVDIGAHGVAGLDVPPPVTMGQTFALLAEQGLISAELAARMKAAVGFRNIAIHTYQQIDWDIVHAIARDHLEDFEDFARAIAETQLR